MAPAADRLTPFFLGPSAGGPIVDEGAGVPLAAGVLGVESEALSALEGAVAWSVALVAGESLAGDSSLVEGSGVDSNSALSLLAGTLSVTTSDDCDELSSILSTLSCLSDLRRSLGPAFLLEGAIV